MGKEEKRQGKSSEVRVENGGKTIVISW